MEYTKKTSRDPFYEAPRQKGYYHPSQKKKLTKKDKKICLSPEKQPSKKETKPLKLADENFLKGTNVYTDKAPPTGDTPSPTTTVSSKFNESWPESERASTIGLVPEFNLSPIQDSDRRLHSTKLDMRPISSESDAPRKGWVPRSSSSSRASGKENKTDADSTLQRYINRFRYDQPMSREARESKTQASNRDFWWLKTKSPSTPGRSSTPKGDTPSPGKMKTRLVRSPLSPYSPMKPGRSSSSSSSRSGYRTRIPVDEMTQKLQEKADRLLEQSESSLSSEPIVSTVGLGSDPSLESSRSRSSGSLVEERPYRPGFIKYMQEKENVLQRGETAGPRRETSAPIRHAPPDDILTQWRLRRKLEMAHNKGSYTSIRLLDAGRGPPSPRKADMVPGTESKLVDFRNRLAKASSGKYASPLKPSSNVHFTPSPPRQEKQQSSSPVREEPERDIPRPHPQIASPTLKCRPGNKDEVEPHLHLMCDILPCPHQTEYQSQVDKCSERLYRGQGLRTEEGRISGKGNNREASRRQHKEQGDEVEKENRDSDIDKKFHGKGELLEDSVNSDVHSKDSLTKARTESDWNQKVDSGENDSAQTFDGSVSFEQDIPVRDSGLAHDVAKKTRNTEDVTDVTDKHSVVTSLKAKQGPRKVPHPKAVKDSPKKRDTPLDDVVGEVVTERLFASPTSSIDSFLSDKNKEAEMSSEQDTLTSDSEDFADDELLKQLHRQREKFESKLKLIDQLLDQRKV